MSEQHRSPAGTAATRTAGTGATRAPGTAATRTAGRLCLAAVVAGPLLTPAFMRGEPELFGWPLFYWYQFLWVPLGAVLLTCAYVLRQRSDGRADDAG